jgi:rubrerythrin
MVTESVLSTETLLDLALRGARGVVDRLDAIHQTANPADFALRVLLAKLETQQRDHVQALEQFRDRLRPGTLDERPLPRTLDLDFPSLAKRLGEGPLDRDFALYFVELLEEEASRFYRRLADEAPAEEVRLFLQQMALSEWGALERLRSVLL